MKKILFVFSELFYGGAETQFRELVTRIDKQLFQCTVVISGTQSKNIKTESDIRFVQNHPEINFYFLKNIRIPRGVLNKLSVFLQFHRQMATIMKKESPDIVLCYSGIELTGCYLYRNCGAKVIFSERESGNRGYIKLLRYRFFFQGVDKIVCNSLDAKRYYETKNIKSIYIPNGIKYYEPFEPYTDADFHITVPARIAKVKNQELVLKAAVILNKKGRTVKISCIGKQEDKTYLSELKKFVVENALKKQIEFLEFSDHIKGIYQNTNLVILPSRMEGFTNVLLESYMFGRICLVSDIVMNRDVANKSQRFFSPDDEEELSRKIEEIMDLHDEDLQKEIYSNHKYAVENFTVEKMVDNYVNLFNLL